MDAPTGESQEATTGAQASTTTLDDTTNSYDNGILDFMSAEKASELYRTIHSHGIPELDWKFYGRRHPDELAAKEKEAQDKQNDDTLERSHDNEETITEPTAFDFDDSFAELQQEESVVNDSLQLKRRSEPGSERKTNLSDIMSDIIKETSQVENEK